MNKMRGEVQIEIDSKKYNLRPTFDAIARIEGNTDNSIIKLASRLSVSDLKVSEIVEIIYQGALAGENEIAREKIQASLLKDGIYLFLKPCMEFIGYALGGENAEIPTKKNETEALPH